MMPGKTFRTRSQRQKKRREIKTRFIQNLESESVLSNPGHAFPFLVHPNHTPILGQPYFKQGWVVWCLLSHRTVQEGDTLSLRGVCLAGMISTHGMNADKTGLPTEPHCTHCWNINPSGWYLGAAIKKKVEDFQKMEHQDKIFLYPYRAGNPSEEWLEFKFSQAGERSGTRPWFNFLTVRQL